MRILALDAATEACSAALMDGDSLIGRYEEIGRGHAERILVMVEELLAESGLGLPALNAIAACIGPGGFTGVRITVATAQGLAFGASLPVVAVSSLEALAWRALSGEDGEDGEARALTCLDARMGEVYWGVYRRDPDRGVAPTQPPRVSPPDAVRVNHAGKLRGIGRGFSAYPGLAQLSGLVFAPTDQSALPDARAIATLGARRFRAGEARDPAELTPLYLRDQVALTEAERHRTVTKGRSNSGLEKSRD
jgi:tRNA threonylcarbamoyladenosine biosynthesis protein TsaB